MASFLFSFEFLLWSNSSEVSYNCFFKLTLLKDSYFNLKQNTHVLYILNGNRKRPFRERDWSKGNKRSHKLLDVFIAMIYHHFYGNNLQKKWTIRSPFDPLDPRRPCIVLNLVTLDHLSPGFHMIVPIASVVSKNFETILTTGTICNFHTIASIAPKTRSARWSAMFLGRTMEFLRVLRKQAEYNGGF